MRYFLFSIVIFVSIYGNAQSIKYEQNAFGYFMDSIFYENYKKIKRIDFSGLTEDELSTLSFGKNCFTDEPQLALKLLENGMHKKFPKKEIIFPSKCEIKIKPVRAKSSKKRLKLSIKQANEIDNKIYITIELVNFYNTVDMYLLELDKNGNVLRWCKTGFGT